MNIQRTVTVFTLMFLVGQVFSKCGKVRWQGCDNLKVPEGFLKTLKTIYEKKKKGDVLMAARLPEEYEQGSFIVNLDHFIEDSYSETLDAELPETTPLTQTVNTATPHIRRIEKLRQETEQNYAQMEAAVTRFGPKKRKLLYTINRVMIHLLDTQKRKEK